MEHIWGILENEYAKFISQNEAIFEEGESKIKFVKIKMEFK